MTSPPAAGAPGCDPAVGAPASSFDQRRAQFECRRAQHNTALTAAYSAAGTHPTDGIASLDALLAKNRELESEELALLVEAGAGAWVTPAQCRDAWAGERTGIFEMRWLAATWGSLDVERAKTSAMAHAELAGRPEDPFWAEVDEWDAELSTDTDTCESLLDRAFPRRMQNGAYLQAARNRMRAAALAGWHARRDRQVTCATEAIAVADAHDLRREQVEFRIARYGMLLIGDQSGAALDALRAEMDFTAQPKGALPDRLRTVYAEGAAQIASADPGTAATIAVSFGLGYEATKMRRAVEAEAVAAARTDAAAALEEQRRGLFLQLLLLCSQFKLALGDAETPAEDILPTALALAATPQESCNVHGAFADAWEERGKLLRAVAAASDAVEAVRTTGPPAVRAQAEVRLDTLRVKVGDAGQALRLDPALDPDDYANHRIQAAVSALIAGAPAAAVETLDGALAVAQDARTRASVQLLRAFALYELERLGEAEADLLAAAPVFAAAYAANPGPDGDLLAQRQNAFLLLAFVYARTGRARESWAALESGHAHLLRTRLGMEAGAWDDVHAALVRRNAALLEVCVLHWGTLVIAAAPRDAEPTAAVFPGFTATDANRLLESPGLGDDSDRWTEILMGAIPGLSAALGPILWERAEAITAGAATLYVMTDGPLAHAPLAALELAPGRTLADLAPFAVIPFASLLLVEDAPLAPEVTAAALATGRDTTGFDFAGHLETLAPVLTEFGAEMHVDTAATVEAFQSAAETAGLLYLSSHGTLNHAIHDVDRASSLLLADGTVSAAAVAGRVCRYRLQDASLAVLNACQSGRFRALTLTETGGFPAAFLLLGRRALIAPLTHVDPAAAVTLAGELLRELRGGATAAEALRTARLRLRDGGAPPSAWAAHQLFGLDTRLCAARA